MNIIHIIGNLGREPETRQVGDHTVCNFSVAVTKKIKGEDKTTWFNIQAWNKLGEICDKFLNKGSKVMISGELIIEEYEKDGVMKQAVKINARDMEMLSPRVVSEEKAEEGDDDLPF